jgi:Dolichyl-phosphate-mannose-protein mannosyltransferase
MRPRPAAISALKIFDGEHFVLGVILALGALVRLSGLDLGWFLQDQVRDGMAAQGILSGQDFPLVGPHAALSTVKLVGPLYYYLVAIPYGLSADPVVGVAFLNLLGVFSIHLTYRLGREMFGPLEGLIAAALYAVFPMAVLSGKALWNPGFVPFFSTLFLLTFWRFLVGGRPWGLALALFLLGVLLQIHMSGAIFVLLLPVALLMYRPPIRRWPLAVGLLSAALLFAPYVVSQFQHGFSYADKIFAWAGRNPASSFWLITGWGFSVPFSLPEQLAAALPAELSPTLFPIVQRVELVLLCLGLLALMTMSLKARDRRPYVLLSLWFALPFVIVPHNKLGVMWYYFDILYPSQFLIIGVLIQMILGGWAQTLVRGWANDGCCVVLALLVSVLVAMQAWFMVSFEKGVVHSGVFRFTEGIFTGSFWKNTLETMPLYYKRALTKHFLNDAGVQHTALERRAHGAMYQLFREDKGFLFRTLAPRPRTVQSDPTLHYLIVRDDFRVILQQGHEATVGAYRIVAYHPTVRYESWRASVSSGPEWWSPLFDDSAWHSAPLPARKIPDPSLYEAIPYARWPEKTMIFRGQMETPSAGQYIWLVVNIRDSHFFPHEVGPFYVNGQLLTPNRTVSYPGINSRNIEVIVDVTPALGATSNLVAFEIKGMNEEFDLDIYELQLARRPEDR